MDLAALQPKILELTSFYLLYTVGVGGKWKSVNPKTVALFPFVI